MLISKTTAAVILRRTVFHSLLCALAMLAWSPGLLADTSPAPTRTVVDMAGRSVTLPDRIERIGTLGAVGVLNALVEVMGEGSRIINRMPGNFARSGRWKMQYEFAPQIAGGPLFESDSRELLVEDLLKAKPDVCLVMTRELADQLERLGLASIYLEWKDLEDIKAAVALMGQVLNKPETSTRYLEYFDRKMAEVATLTAGLTPGQRPTVLYGNPLQFSQPHQIAEWWIERAGGRSVTADSPVKAGLKYGLEDLLTWNPEVMILLNPQDAEEMKRTEAFMELRAVKNEAFHFMPTVAHTWGNRTVEQPLTVLWTLSKLHPELMPRARLAQEISYFYRTFVGYELSDQQLADIIMPRDN